MFFLLDVEKSKKDNFLKNIFYINNLYPKKNQQDTGEYTFKIDVPDAVFYQQQGDIYVSVYFQGSDKELSISQVEDSTFRIFPNPTTDRVTVEGSKKVIQLSLYNLDGRILKTEKGRSLSLQDQPKGMYLLRVETENGQQFTHKIIKK